MDHAWYNYRFTWCRTPTGEWKIKELTRRVEPHPPLYRPPTINPGK
jgi:hypothetical protein